MSKVLPVATAVVLSGLALIPIFYASSHPYSFQPKNSFKADSATPVQVISYTLGYELGSKAPAEVDITAFSAGFRAAHEKEKFPFSENDVNSAYQKFVAEQQQHSQSEQSAIEKNMSGADVQFLADNAKKPNVKTTPSGLQYTVIKEGTGKSPKSTDTVTVHYEGRLINGQVFDSSFARGEPASFALDQVIPGWTEGLQLMKEGGETIFYIPANLAYGSRDMGTIPANSTLIFKVQLLKVQ